ncbi:xin actin-binding repeat-containing protein 2 [Electrophorus electricus]|uniref:xin actin-binding repeat-containing protein 2 n=1 Tax=Electrophorus electricus TaxID=8005 RepID=UPI0015D0732F|nr:xin actin-binding repeat-containing protein 2 [Electrophorus electricus]XP_026870588.2 xin actin-binding repeat-containing protein 2 [Electrophorus electricus]
MYQAASSTQDAAGFSSRVLEEVEVCSLPGGLASIRRQFEREQNPSAQTVTQYHYKQKSGQDTTSPIAHEVPNSSVPSVRSGMRGGETQQDERDSHDESSPWGAASTAENHQVAEEEEYYPKLSTKELAKHFEKTIEEAAPHKKIKIEHDVNHSKWASGVNVHHHDFKGEIVDISKDIAGATGAETETPGTVHAIEDDDSDYLPPPPPDLLEELPEDTGFPVPPEPACAMRHTESKDQYFKQRELLELKRLCKHIHPDVRKDLERDLYNEVNEMDEHKMMVGDVQEAAYYFEHSGSSPNQSPEREYLEWDEILRGEVQSVRWMFENRPLDCIKDSSDDEEDSRRIVQQEIIAGGDVRSTALMFETQPMDMLRVDNGYAGKKISYNETGQKGVRAAAWLFETKPMDSLNKMHGDDEQTKEVVFTQAITRGNVKSMRYMFENPEMDCLGDAETMDEKHLLNLKSVVEEIKADMKITIWQFETQCKCVLREHSGEVVEITSVHREETEKGDVKTSRWLFETQPLDKINQDFSQFRLISSISMEDYMQGDVKRGRWLFETKKLDSTNEEWQSIQGQQKEEILGADVRRHCMVFETQPMDTLKDDSNSRPAATEEIIGGDVQSVRHLFETAPLNESKELPEVGKLKKRVAAEGERGDLRHQKWEFENQSLESIQNEDGGPGRLKKTVASEEEKGDVRHQKWLFENQKLEDIREEKKEVIKMVNIEQNDEESYKGDVRRNCWVFETQAMDTLKDDSNAKPVNTEEIIGGDVQSARHFFESAPKDELKELAEVGKLKRTVTVEEEKGDVQHQKCVFESQPLEQIREEKKEISRTVDIENVEKVDVTSYKQIFERYDKSQRIQVEGVTKGSVKSNKDLFESTPLYAMQDSSGHYHELKTVRHEEIVKGDVKSYKWMFETCPIDQFDESITKFQVIKGITQQEVEAGDVKTAKWLFETQPLDAIKYFSNIEDEAYIAKEMTEIVKGDVQTCKWLFETKPMDVLYDKADIKNENDANEVHKGDVKTCTWLFETQALDAIRDESEAVLKACTVQQEDIQGKDVRMACFLFETENLDSIAGKEGHAFKRVTEIDVQSGDVSRMKYIFETQASDVMTSTSEEFMHQLKTAQAQDIQKGNVGNCKWLFENQPIDVICQDANELKGVRTVTDVQGGDVDKGRFIFETCSLDKIQEVSSVSETQKIICEEDEKGDVKNYAMMFETLPLYAIQDKDGHYHEVTTLTKEEVLKGDVVGARWLFETKPLDSIKETDEVYIIKAVTEEDIQKGDVSSARWRFETQPLDMIADDIKISLRTVEDIKGGDVKANKQHFESDLMSHKLIRTVSMSEIHKGDVKAAKWMFETHTIDQIHGDNSEDEMEKVIMQERVKGDVKQSVWLFEKNPLDHIKENGESREIVREEIPKADVKTTTWLFETTPISEFSESNIEKMEIIGKSIKGTLDELYSQKMVESTGIIIETDEVGDVRMAKYNLMNKEAPKIQKEEIIKGDLQNIMMNLLNRRDTKEKGIVIDAEERGNISNTVQQLLHQQPATNVEKEEIIGGDVQEAINNLLEEKSLGKHGILIQEDEKGDVRMTIYSLFNEKEDATTGKEDVIRGHVKGCPQKLYNPTRDVEEMAKIKVDDTEKGKVSFYSTCIESGALDYLKQIQVEPGEDESGNLEKEEIVGGDIKGTKLSLTCNQAQICRLVDKEDIVPGDVYNTVKVFMTEPPVLFEHLHKEEIVGGDLRATLDSLSQSINQSVVLEKEEVVKGDIPTALKSLEEAQKQPKEVEKPKIVPGDIKGALKSLKDSATTKVEIVIEDLVSGDIKGTLKSLEEAKQAVKEMEKEEIVRGDIHTALQNLQEASNERKAYQQEIAVQGDVKGTIQLLLETPSSPRMQRRASTEGDVKLSIKSLYESQEQVQSEKEEVIKGDVKGTIKCLLETAQRASPKVPRREPIRRVKVSKVKTPSSSQQEIQAQRLAAAVKNLSKSSEAKRHVQKLVGNKSMQSGSTSLEKNTLVDQTTTNRQTSKTTILEHNTIVQTHGVKTLKTEFRNLNSGHTGMISLDKTKDVQQEVCAALSPSAPQLPESDSPLPPSPPPDYDSLFLTTPPPLTRGDNDLPPPPTPPPSLSDALKSDLDHLPPPPPPSPPPGPAAGQEFLPPPPSQQELDLIPYTVPAKPTKLTVKPVKAPALCKVPKLEPAMQFNTTDMQAQATVRVTSSHKTVEKISKEQSRSDSNAPISSEITPDIAMQPPESPRPPKKNFAPVSLTPPASPLPSKSPISKFKTPLIKAEQKFRQQQEESYTPPSSPAFEIHMHESVRSALEMISSDGKNTTQSEQGISVHFTEEKAEQTVSRVKSDTESYDSSKRVILSDVTARKPLISSTNEKSPSEFDIISSVKGNISNQPCKATSCQQQTTSTTSKKKKKYRSMTTSFHQVTSASAMHSQMIISNSAKIQSFSGGKGHQMISENDSLTSEIKMDADKQDTASTLVTEKPKAEELKNIDICKNKAQEKNPPVRAKVNTDSKIKEAEQKSQKADSHKTKKGSKNGKEEVTEKQPMHPAQSVKVEHESVKVKESRERKLAEAETKVEKQAKQKETEEAQATPKKKRRTKPKKDKEAAEHAQGQAQNNTTAIEPAPSSEAKHLALTSGQTHEEIAVVQTQRIIQGECSEVNSTRGKVQQSLHTQGATAKPQKQAMVSPKNKGEAGSQTVPDISKDKSRNVPLHVTGKPAQGNADETAAENRETTQQCAEARRWLANTIALQEGEGKVDYKSVKTLLSELPEWIFGPMDRHDLEEDLEGGNILKVKEVITQVQNLIQAKLMHLEGDAETVEKHDCEATFEKLVSGIATQRISKITIGSTKVETQKKAVEEKKATHKSRKQQQKSLKSSDPRAPSPSLRMRSPSPTFITIESIRRTDSPQRVVPSPPPMPPTPPPRWSETPTPRLSRASPSPTLGRADSLTRLRETTAKLSRGPSPDPVPRPLPLKGKKSEIVETPATFHRQIKIDSTPAEEARFLEEQKDMKSSGAAVSESVTASVQEMREFFEGAQKVEENKTLVQKDRIEHTGLHMQHADTEVPEKEKEPQTKVDLSALANKFEMPEEKVHTKKVYAGIPERLEGPEPNRRKKANQQESTAAYDMKIIKSVFEMGEQSSSINEQQNKQEEHVSGANKIVSDDSKHELQQSLQQQGSPPPLCKEVTLEKSVDPTGFSETQTITRNYCTVDEFGMKMSGTRSSTTISKHSESVFAQCPPFSYADAVKKKAPEVKTSPEASAEELLKNFHKTWAESESAFESPGYSDSDSSSKVGAVHGVSEEGVPHGGPVGGQKEVP